MTKLYLFDAPDSFIWNRSKPICDVPLIGIGNKPIDGGNYLFKPEEKESFIKEEPGSAAQGGLGIGQKLHNAWMRVVCGRMKSDYRYSGGVVYNNFVWPDCDDVAKARVEKCAQAVLDARGLYPDSTMADMYDPNNDFLYPELTAARKALDAAVEAAYGVDFNGDEEKIVAHLFKLYAEACSE